MEVDAVLCDHAEVAEGKLFLNGGAIGFSWVQPQPPHVINIAVGLVIQVPYTATNQVHNVAVSLVEADGPEVVVTRPDGELVPVRGALSFNLGRPPQLAPGDPQAVPIGMNFPGLVVPHQGAYAFTVTVDGTVMRRLPFRVAVVQQPGVQAAPAA